jgi:hypothetical protein
MKKYVVLSILTLLFIFLLLSNIIFDEIFIISYWLIKNNEIIYWIRFLYAIFYGIYFIRFISKNIYKIEINTTITIVVLGFISNIIWLIEILLHGWEGLIWLKYSHVAFYIIYVLFIFWLIIINKRNKIKTILFKIVCYSFIYLIFMKIFIDTFYAHFNIFRSFIIYVLVFNLHIMILDNIYTYHILIIFIQILLLFCFNIIITKIEKNKINKNIILLILVPIITIPLTTVLASFIISRLSIMPYHGLYLDPIHWLKMGNIIFGFIIYECTYIAYLNKN